jgi:septal ring factor EnvC (AmiA/AmiB activator)
MEASAIEVRLRNHEARIEANHRSTSTLRDSTARHETEIKVAGTELRETREDIAEIRRDLAASRAEQKAEMTWLRRGLWAAAGTFLLFFVAVASLLVQLGGS